MRTWIQWLFRLTAIFAALLATAQPLLGSFSFFRPADPVSYDTIHLVAGAGIYNSSFLLAAMAAFTGFQRRWYLLACSTLLYVATHAQLLLGLESDTDAGLLAFHIPLGVLILILTYVIAVLSFGARLEPRET